MGLRLNELSPAEGSRKNKLRVVVVSVLVSVKPVVVVSKVKPHVQVLVFAQVLKAVRCLYTVVCQNLVSPVNLQW